MTLRTEKADFIFIPMCLKKSERKKDAFGSKTLKKNSFHIIRKPNNLWLNSCIISVKK